MMEEDFIINLIIKSLRIYNITMTQLTTLLEVRKELKERKPEFIRQDNPKRKKLNYKWRKPKGIHSKIRHHFKGRRKMPSPGYKSPAAVKGLHSTGLEMVRVFSAGEVSKIKKESQGIIVPGNVGKRKKLEILRKAKELSVQVLNLKIDEAIKKIEDFISSKTKSRKEAKAKEEKEEKQKPKENISEEEKREAEKKEKDRVLTKKV